MLAKKVQEICLSQLMLIARNIDANCVEEVHVLLLVFDGVLARITLAKPLHCRLHNLTRELQSLLLGLLVASRLVRMVLVELLEIADIFNTFPNDFTKVHFLRITENIHVNVQQREHFVIDARFQINQ